MDLSKTLEALDSMLSAPQTTPMTKEQFEAYAVDQVEKAKAEAAEEDPKGKDKAKKRLAHLRSTVDTLAKAEGTYPAEAWSGDNGTALIPEYDHGFEDTTRKTEISSADMTTPPAGNAGTQADGQSFAAAGSAQGFADAKGGAGAPSGTNVPASGTGTQGDGTIFSGAIGKALGDLKKTVGGLTKPVAKAAPPAAKTFLFPSDMADKAYVKDGVQKRADDHWGTDVEAAK